MHPFPMLGVWRRGSFSWLLVVLKLVASCRWNCGLDKLATILKMKTFHTQLAIHAAAWNVYLFKYLCLVHSFFCYLSFLVIYYSY
jgi:hypothetical protein